MRALAINVGANTNLPGFRAPVWPDGSFEWLPIPEREPTATAVPTYGEFATACGLETDVTDVADIPVHADPEFPEAAGERYTYGDEHGVKARPIAELAPGDHLLFYATLSQRGGQAADHPPDWGAYLIAAFEVARVVTGERYGELSPAERAPWANNAHVKRESFDARVLVHGDPDGSRLFETAVPLSAPTGGTDANELVTELSTDSGKGPWWRRPLRYEGDAAQALLDTVADSGV